MFFLRLNQREDMLGDIYLYYLPFWLEGRFINVYNGKAFTSLIKETKKVAIAFDW